MFSSAEHVWATEGKVWVSCTDHIEYVGGKMYRVHYIEVSSDNLGRERASACSNPCFHAFTVGL